MLFPAWATDTVPEALGMGQTTARCLREEPRERRLQELRRLNRKLEDLEEEAMRRRLNEHILDLSKDY